MRHSKSKSKRSNDKPMPVHWHKIIQFMVYENLEFTQAAMKAGLSESYAKSGTSRRVILEDVRFCAALDKELAKIRVKAAPRRARRLKDLDDIIEDPGTLARDKIQAIQVQGRMCGWLSETIRHETTERQAKLDAEAQKQAALLSTMSLNTLALPDVAPIRRKSVASVIVAGDATEEVTRTSHFVDDELDNGTPEKS